MLQVSDNLAAASALTLSADPRSLPSGTISDATVAIRVGQ